MRSTLRAFHTLNPSSNCPKVVGTYHDEQSWFLGRDTQNVDLVPFWHKHLEDEAYCIPCELMLCFDEQWIRVPGESPLELGIGTARAQALIEKAMGKIPALGDLSIA